MLDVLFGTVCYSTQWPCISLRFGSGLGTSVLGCHPGQDWMLWHRLTLQVLIELGSALGTSVLDVLVELGAMAPPVPACSLRAWLRTGRSRAGCPGWDLGVLAPAVPACFPWSWVRFGHFVLVVLVGAGCCVPDVPASSL